jgi:hypothetical protein
MKPETGPVFVRGRLENLPLVDLAAGEESILIHFQRCHDVRIGDANKMKLDPTGIPFVSDLIDQEFTPD